MPRSKTSLSGPDRVFLGTKEPTKVLLDARKAFFAKTSLSEPDRVFWGVKEAK